MYIHGCDLPSGLLLAMLQSMHRQRAETSNVSRKPRRPLLLATLATYTDQADILYNRL